MHSARSPIVIHNHVHAPEQTATPAAPPKPTAPTPKPAVHQVIPVNNYGEGAVGYDFPGAVTDAMAQAVQTQIPHGKLLPLLLVSLNESIWWRPSWPQDHANVRDVIGFLCLSVLYGILVNTLNYLVYVISPFVSMCGMTAKCLLFMIRLVLIVLDSVPVYVLGLMSAVGVFLYHIVRNANRLIRHGHVDVQFADMMKFCSLVTPDRQPDDQDRLTSGDVRPTDLAIQTTGAISSATLAIYEVVFRDLLGEYHLTYPVFRELMDRFMRHFSRSPSLEDAYDWLTHNGAYNVPADVCGQPLALVLRCMTRFCCFEHSRRVAEERHDVLVSMTADRRWLSFILKRIIVLHYQRITMCPAAWVTFFLLVVGFLAGVPAMLLGLVRHAGSMALSSPKTPFLMDTARSFFSVAKFLFSRYKQLVVPHPTANNASLSDDQASVVASVIAIGSLMCVLPVTIVWAPWSVFSGRRLPKLIRHQPAYFRRVLCLSVAAFILSWSYAVSNLTSSAHITQSDNGIYSVSANTNVLAGSQIVLSNLTSNLAKVLPHLKLQGLSMHGMLNLSVPSDPHHGAWMKLFINLDALLSTSVWIKDQTTCAEFCPTYMIEMKSIGIDSPEFLIENLSMASGSMSLTTLLLKHISLTWLCGAASY